MNTFSIRLGLAILGLSLILSILRRHLAERKRRKLESSVASSQLSDPDQQFFGQVYRLERVQLISAGVFVTAVIIMLPLLFFGFPATWTVFGSGGIGVAAIVVYGVAEVRKTVIDVQRTIRHGRKGFGQVD